MTASPSGTSPDGASAVEGSIGAASAGVAFAGAALTGAPFAGAASTGSGALPPPGGGVFSTWSANDLASINQRRFTETPDRYLASEIALEAALPKNLAVSNLQARHVAAQADDIEPFAIDRRRASRTILSRRFFLLESRSKARYPNGLAISGASVSLSSVSTGRNRDAITDETGLFIFASIEPGQYTLKVSQGGFKTFVQSDITLVSGERLALGSIALEIGQTSESVTVRAQGGAVQTQSVERAAVITSAQVDGLLIQAGSRRGTFLPSVWEQVRSTDDFLSMLWSKAGLRPGSWPRGLTVERYRTHEFGDPGPRDPIDA